VSIKDVDCAKVACQTILKKYDGIHIGIAITLGEKGVVWMSKTDFNDTLHVPSSKVTVVDTSVSF
jgi:hypothetical protein